MKNRNNLKLIIVVVLLLIGLIRLHYFNKYVPMHLDDLNLRGNYAYGDGTASWNTGADLAKKNIIFIHGMWGSKFVAEPLIPHLTDSYRLYALDLHGHGYSEHLGEMNWQAHVAQILKFMSLRKLTRVVLVGYSMGGAIAQAFAVLYPELVSHLVLVDSLSFFSPHPKATYDDIQFNLNPEGDVMAKAGRRFILKFPFLIAIPKFFFGRFLVRSVLKRAYFDPSLIDTNLVSRFMHPMSSDEFWKHVLKLLTSDDPKWFSMIRGLLWKKRKELTFTMIWGKEDRWIPVRKAQFLQKTFPKSKLYLIDNTGHIPTIESPKAFSEILRHTLSHL